MKLFSAKAKEVFSVNPRLLNSVEAAAAKEKSEKEVEKPAAPVNDNRALKGISAALLAKVRKMIG